MINQSYNTLIAGVIGSGKSTIAKGIIDRLVSETNAALVLIDPKRVELVKYRNHPRCLWYADTADCIHDTLQRVYDLMELRYRRMQASGQTATDEPHVFVVIDEMAFLMQSKRKREYVQLLNQITLLGRAARIHLILCTQVSTQDVIPACIRDNMTNIVCLKQRDAQKYRYLLGANYEPLPLVGFAYVLTPDRNVPEKVTANEVFDALVK